MRIVSGNITTYVYFEARDVLDRVTPENGLAAKMVVKRSRNGGALTTMTTPTINATDTGTGGYELLVDEDTTIDAGFHSQEMRLRVRDTGGHMAEAIRVVELFRPDVTAGQTLTVSSGRGQADVRAILGDTGLVSNVGAAATLNSDGLFGSAANELADAVWDEARSGHTTTGTFGEYVLADVQRLDGDTGAANQLEVTFANGFNDTGLNDRLSRIGFDADTGLRDVLAAVDTGLRDYIDNTDTGLRKYIDNLDTGIKNRFDDLAEDTGGVNVTSFADTGVNDRLAKILADTDTGISSNNDTGAIVNAIFGAPRIDGRKFQEALRLYAAVLGGKVEGAGTSTEIFSRTDTGTARITAVVDSAGNRSSITYALDT